MNNSRKREKTERSGLNQCQIRRWVCLIYTGVEGFRWLLAVSKGVSAEKVTSFFSRMLINVGESYPRCDEFNLGRRGWSRARQRHASISLHPRLSWISFGEKRTCETRFLPICQHNPVESDLQRSERLSPPTLRQPQRFFALILNIYVAISRDFLPAKRKKGIIPNLKFRKRRC